MSDSVAAQRARALAWLNDVSRWPHELSALLSRHYTPEVAATIAAALQEPAPLSAHGTDPANLCPRCGVQRRERIAGLWLCQACGHEWDDPAAAEPRQPAPAWQPIETVPLGRRVLVAMPNGDLSMAFYNKHSEPRATHWMLIEPPAAPALRDTPGTTTKGEC